MSDFFQPGPLTTLQKLEGSGQRTVELVERLLPQRHLTLILPSLYSEFEGAAMPGIIAELATLDWVDRIVLSLDRADAADLDRARAALAPLGEKVHVLWNDGPAVGEVLEELRSLGVPVERQGKGRGVWLSMGYALSLPETDVIAVHDCDILSYRTEMLARLVYPLLDPSLCFEFAKGFYARVSGRLYGRVSRLLFTPLVRALGRSLPASSFLTFLDSFRYPLSGELAMTAGLARRLRFSSGWGLELGLLSEVEHHLDASRVCQVELADTYEHKHQELSGEQRDGGLYGMAREITEALLHSLAERGVGLGSETLPALPSVYLLEGSLQVERFHALAAINGLAHDRAREAAEVELLVGAVRDGLEAYQSSRQGQALLPPWSRWADAPLGDLRRWTGVALRAEREEGHGLPAAVLPEGNGRDGLESVAGVQN